MFIWKKAKDIGIISILSVFIGVSFYTLFKGPIGFDFNTLFLYRDNYSTPSDQIAIVKIDSESLDELQKTDFRVLSLSKTVYANLINKLEAQGARAIGFDVVFSNPASDEMVLGEMLQKYKNIVIGAWMEEGRQKAIHPLESYSGATWGSVNTKIEKNVVTKVRPEYSFSGRSVESLAIATYRKYLGNNSVWVYQEGEYKITPLRKIPTDSDQNVLIKFFRPPEDYPSYSLSDVLNDRVPKEKIAGKAILVGEYGTLIHDAYTSPVDPERQMPGVEFHANLLDSLIQNSPLEKQGDTAFVVSLFLAVLALTIVLYFSGTTLSIIVLVLYGVLLLVAGRHLLNQSGVVIDLFAYAVTGLATFVSVTLYRYLVTNRDKRYIEKAFSHYLAPEVVRKIAADPDSFKLGGEKREITIFFSDIASFTTISEALGTEKIFALMEEYLSAMTDILIANQGTLDKYIGDAVMGFFNAPLSIEKSEYLACKTALEQQETLVRLNIGWAEQWIPHIVARIGINTGEAMVGNIGSQERFNYTAIGDHVNLAARLEGVNKEYGTLICVGTNTYEKARSDFFFRELDMIRVKGKTEGIKIYELVGHVNDTSFARLRYEVYESALSLYYKGLYKEAQSMFEGNTMDTASEIMARRCQEILEGKVEVVNGVYEMKNK